MGVCVFVVGKSGSGKSTSLRNFKADEVGILNVMGKPLPFRNGAGLVTMDVEGYSDTMAAIKSGKRKCWVVDDAGYLMQNENFARARESGYGKFTEMAQHFQGLVNAAARETPADCITYFMMHPEDDGKGGEKIKTVGRMLDEKFCLEGASPLVVDCEVRDGEHVFVTKNDGANLAKAPMGMLPDVMPNDLFELDRAAREYWGMEPLRAAGDNK